MKNRLRERLVSHFVHRFEHRGSVLPRVVRCEKDPPPAIGLKRKLHRTRGVTSRIGVETVGKIAPDRMSLIALRHHIFHFHKSLAYVRSCAAEMRVNHHKIWTRIERTARYQRKGRSARVVHPIQPPFDDASESLAECDRTGRRM